MNEMSARPHLFLISEQTPARDAKVSGLKSVHPMDSEEAQKTLRMLLGWFYREKDEIQAANRLEMSIDADAYDNLQWDEEDAAIVRSRGQMPLVYNEVSPMVDWIIGTERRTRVDWRVLPRTEDDVKMAEIKTKLLKYFSDVNRAQFVRSSAFEDAVKVGIGWVDDGIQDDPTREILYSKYESWRNVVWDSSGLELDLSDARYIFRWRWVDEDTALATFPDRAAVIRQAFVDARETDPGWDDWWMGASLRSRSHSGSLSVGQGPGAFQDTQQKFVRVIEAQYRKPVQTMVVVDGPLKGRFVDDMDEESLGFMFQGVNGSSIVNRVMMRVHYAIFLESAMLRMGVSPYQHNRFTLTPVWCYRRSKDRLPYGPVRRVRDVQNDINKRMSKASWLMNTNQIIAEEGATDDWDKMAEEAADPSGTLVHKPGKKFELRRDAQAVGGQLDIVQISRETISRSIGVTQENLGRPTNAVSGIAIQSRQLQGSVVLTQPFDNLRLAAQVQGEKQLSMIEQFLTEERVVRLTGERGTFEWLKINHPEVLPDGSVRFLDDITATMADFKVTDADYAGTIRQVMFESLFNLAARLPPELALRVITVAMEHSDLPNKEEIANQMRAMTGERDPRKELTEEEMLEMQEQAAADAEAEQIQREALLLALQEQQAKVRELNARALSLEAKAQSMAVDEKLRVREIIDKVRRQASLEIERLSNALRKSQLEATARVAEARSDDRARVGAARVSADARIRVAEIQEASNRRIASLEQQLGKALQELQALPRKEQPLAPPDRR